MVVTGVTGGRAGLKRLMAAILRWWWLVAATPLILLGVWLTGRVFTGQGMPAWTDLWRINGFPAWGPAGVLALLVVVNGLGEETGRRGFLQPRLQSRMRPLLATLVVAVIWAGWHVPLFAILTGFRGFTPGTLAGFAIGMVCGAVVLGWLYNRTGSILAVAVWHATFNLATAPVAATVSPPPRPRPS